VRQRRLPRRVHQERAVGERRGRALDRPGLGEAAPARADLEELGRLRVVQLQLTGAQEPGAIEHLAELVHELDPLLGVGHAREAGLEGLREQPAEAIGQIGRIERVLVGGEVGAQGVEEPSEPAVDDGVVEAGAERVGERHGGAT
jgi:hypothetical protein